MLTKRTFVLPLVAALLLAALLAPQLLVVAAPAPVPEAAPVLAAGKTYIDWAVVKHLTVQSGGIETSSNLDMGTYIISNIGNAATDFDTSGGLTTAGESTFNGGIDLNGQTFKIDADADTTLAAATDDQALLTLGAATGYLGLVTGNLKVGNGSPTVTLNGEDAYVEGTFEVDGAVRFDGAIDANSTLGVNGAVRLDSTLGVTGVATLGGGADLNGATLTIDADADTTLAAGTDDQALFTIGAAAGYLQVTTGNLKVGNGSPTVAQDGEDAYVEGVLEVDGTTRLDGALDANSNVGIAGYARIDGALGVTGTATFSGAIDANGNLGVNGTIIGNSTLAVTSTSDLRGAVANSTGILTLNDSVDIGAVLRATGAAIFNSTLAVTGTTTLGGALDLNAALGMTGNLSVGGTLAVTSTSDLRGDISDSGGILTLNDSVDISNIARFAAGIIANSTVDVTGTVTLGGALDANSTAGFNGAVAMDSTLGVTGTATFNGAVNAEGNLSVEGKFDLGSHATFTPTYTVNTPSTWMLVPTASFYHIGSGGAVTMTLAITNVVDGQYLVIYGEDANTVTINDINLVAVGGSTLNLTQYDVGVFIYIDAISKWAQISLVDNT